MTHPWVMSESPQYPNRLNPPWYTEWGGGLRYETILNYRKPSLN
jgi:hypothetical protein